jgi:hypothetical protein
MRGHGLIDKTLSLKECESPIGKEREKPRKENQRLQPRSSHSKDGEKNQNVRSTVLKSWAIDKTHFLKESDCQKRRSQKKRKIRYENPRSYPPSKDERTGMFHSFSRSFRRGLIDKPVM